MKPTVIWEERVCIYGILGVLNNYPFVWALPLLIKTFNASCPHCNIDKESSLHALWSCPCLTPIWKDHFDWLIKKALNCSSMLDIIQLCQEKNNLLELFAMTAALIWPRWNQFRAGEASVPIERICSMAVDNL